MDYNFHLMAEKMLVTKSLLTSPKNTARTELSFCWVHGSEQRGVTMSEGTQSHVTQLTSLHLPTAGRFTSVL